MNLTEEAKAEIDGKRYEELLRRLRFAPPGDPWFQGETGDYWFDRMKELRSRPGGEGEHVSASKTIGW